MQTTRKYDLDPMTLIYEFDLDILKMYLHSKNEDRHTHTDTTERITVPQFAAFTGCAMPVGLL